MHGLKPDIKKSRDEHGKVFDGGSGDIELET
jgi:hypothetical protein